jgi:hypothetical protein
MKMKTPQKHKRKRIPMIAPAITEAGQSSIALEAA